VCFCTSVVMGHWAEISVSAHVRIWVIVKFRLV